MCVLCVKRLKRARLSIWFGDRTGIDQDFELDESVLNAQGEETISLESKWSDAKSPLQLIVQASLQESGGRPITVDWCNRCGQPNACRGCAVRGAGNGDDPASIEVLIADNADARLGGR